MLTVEGVDHAYAAPSGVQKLLIRGAVGASVPVLHDVDLKVEPGEIVGLVGPNGAGKTTLIKIISTLLHPSAGRVTVDGFDTVAQPLEVRRRLGLVLADDRALYWRMTGRSNLEFFGAMHGQPDSVARRRSDELLARVGLADRDKLVFGYSSGMRARLSIARALIDRPQLLVLDEPTRALDPLAAAEVIALLGELAQEGAAILMSSHRLDELQGACDRVVVLAGGVVRFSGTPTELAEPGDFAEAIRALLTAESEGGET